MLFKTYQKLLGASCLVLYLVGCGGGESPIEMRTENNGEFQINSKVDSVTIQGVKLNRGNCIVNFVPVEKVVERGGLSQITPISMQDFKDVASVYELFNEKKELANIENKISQLKSKGVMMELQTLKFGETFTAHYKCQNLIEVEVKTNKGAWTFNFDR